MDSKADNESICKPDITAIVVNYNTPNLTNQAIASIVNNSQEISKEVIVVDNGSDNGNCEKIKLRWNDSVTLIRNKCNLGFAKGNNQAMKIASGRYYLLLNSDAMLTVNSLGEMVRYADNNPEVGILGCKVTSESGEQQSSCWRIYNLPYLFSRALNLYRLFPDRWFGTTNIEQYGKPQETTDVEVVSGCVMLVRKSAVEKVGLFDERFFMYCEDMDWCARMQKGEFAVRYFSGAKVVHFGGATSMNMINETTIEQSRSILKFMHKHYGVLVCYFANILLGLFFLIRLPVWLLRNDKGIAKKKFHPYLRSLIWHVGWPLLSR